MLNLSVKIYNTMGKKPHYIQSIGFAIAPLVDFSLNLNAGYIKKSIRDWVSTTFLVQVPVPQKLVRCSQ